MADCIFCKIAGGSIPSTKVDETANVYAFRDIDPQAPTHVLLIPKKHTLASAAEVDAKHGALLAEMLELAARIAKREGLGGWRLEQHRHLRGGRP